MFYTMKKILTLICLINFIFIGQSKNILVSNTKDSGSGSLRSAVASSVDGDTIRFNPDLLRSGSDSIVLASSIDFEKEITIKGLYNKKDTLYISGANTTRLFYISNTSKVTLDSLVLINGNTSYSGSCILFTNSDSLIVTNSILRNNTSLSNGGSIYSSSSKPLSIFIENSNFKNNIGGGIYSNSRSSSITVIGSIFTKNSATNGGGISSVDNSSSNDTLFITLINSVISENYASNDGGGIYVRTENAPIEVKLINTVIGDNSAVKGCGVYAYSYSGKPFIILDRSIIRDNVSNNALNKTFTGGGIYTLSNSASISLKSSTIKGNNSQYGGGIYSESRSSRTEIILLNSTISDNKAITDGGGIYQTGYYLSLLLTNSTIGNNSAERNGGGAYCKTYTATSTSVNMTLTNSTVYGNTAKTIAGLYSDSFGSSTLLTKSSIVMDVFYNDGKAISSGGYNIFSTTPVTGSVSTDQLGISTTSLKLNQLTNNGGLTETFLPQPNSVAINKGTPTDLTDAQNRPVFNRRDVGAAEYCEVKTGVDIQVACNAFTWIDGNTYTESNNAATYTLFGGASSGCDSIITLDLTINYLDVSLTIDEPSITANIVEEATFRWLDCNNDFVFIDNTTNSFIASTIGSYAVEISTAECVDTSECVDLLIVGINEKQLANSVQIYPNPTNGKIIIDLIEDYSDVSFKLRSLDGKIINSNSFNKLQKTELEIDGEVGFYILELTVGSKKETFKVLKQ